MSILEGSKYANVTSTLALVVALGGTGAYAANTIGSSDIVDNSVRSADIRNKNVAGADLADNAVTSTKVRNGSLRRGDFAAGQFPAGPRGPAGPQGAPGADGTAVAYATVDENGAIQQSTTPLGITADMITHTPGSGLYCFDQSKLGFVPGSAMVAGDNSFGFNDTTVSVLTFNQGPPDGCQVRVRTANSTGQLVDRPFTIWFL